MCDRLTEGASGTSAHVSACYFAMGSGQPRANRALLEEFPYAHGFLTNVKGNRAPTFSGGQAAWADLNSALRPCFERQPGGDMQTLRHQSTPMSITMTPQHYEWQQPDNSAKIRIHSRVEQAKCMNGPKCQVRAIS